MSDTTLGTVVLLTPVALAVLAIPPSRRAVLRPVRYVCKLLALLLMLLAVVLAGGAAREGFGRALRNYEAELEPPKGKHRTRDEHPPTQGIAHHGYGDGPRRQRREPSVARDRDPQTIYDAPNYGDVTWYERLETSRR